MRKNVTILTIAEHLSLSPAAVSAVLSNRYIERRIAEATAEKIRVAAKELGYIPNLAGRRLQRAQVGASANQVDIAIISSYEAPLQLVSRALKALQQETEKMLATNEFNISIEMFHAGRLRERKTILDASRYNGVIISNTLPEDDQFLQETRLPYPAVIIGRQVPGYSCVYETPGHTGRNAASILLGSGSKHPAVLHGTQITKTTQGRIDAFEEEIKSSMDIAPPHIITEHLTASDAISATKTFLKKHPSSDGIFTTTDVLAAGAYQAIKDLGYRIGEDIAIVGIGDSDYTEFFDPQLTTLVGKNSKLIERASNVLLQHITGKRKVPEHISITPFPVIHKSSSLKSLRTT